MSDNITDELAGEILNMENLEKILKTSKDIIQGTVKGIVLLLQGAEFSEKQVMKELNRILLASTGDIQFSEKNVNIAKLQESGTVKKIEDNITADVMKHFDRHCKKMNVNYTAVKDNKDINNPTYMVFFSGKNTEEILTVMTEAYKDYMKEQSKHISKQQQKDQGKNKSEKGSLLAKLAFFRNRVADQERKRQEAVEKNTQREDRSTKRESVLR